MTEFSYHRPTSLADALARLAGAGARPLAGGTDLIPQWREGRREMASAVDLKAIPELTAVSFDPKTGAKIGAAAPCAELYALPWLAANYPALDDACRLIGGWQIQQRASLGGNLCNASPSADSIAPLVVLEAVCEIAGPNGTRTLPVAQFTTGPGATALAAGELLVALRLPAPTPRSGSAYLRFTPRAEMDIAIAGAGVWLALDGAGAIAGARIALSAVGPTILRAPDAEQFLIGKSPAPDVFAEAGARARASAKPIDDLRASADYRRHLTGVLVTRALTLAASRIRP